MIRVLLCLVFFSSVGLSQSYRLRAGDVVSVRVFERAELDSQLTVTSGPVTYPGVGTLTFEGKTLDEVETAIRTALEKQGFQKSWVGVLLLETEPRAAYVNGAVTSPGEYPLPVSRPLRLSQLLAMAGGLTEEADRGNIKIHRADPQAPGGVRILHASYADIAERDQVAQDLTIEDGDTVFVAEAGRPVFYLMGAFNAEGQYPLPRSGTLTVSQAVVLGGGVNEFAKTKKLLIHRNQQTFEVNLDDILRGKLEGDVPIQNGDRIVAQTGLW